jgi:hypothetical protein
MPAPPPAASMVSLEMCRLIVLLSYRSSLWPRRRAFLRPRFLCSLPTFGRRLGLQAMSSNPNFTGKAVQSFSVPLEGGAYAVVRRSHSRCRCGQWSKQKARRMEETINQRSFQVHGKLPATRQWSQAARLSTALVTLVDERERRQKLLQCQVVGRCCCHKG